MDNLVIKDICFPRKYKDKSGEEKINWIKIGTSFEKDGKQNIELYTIPVGVEGKLKASVFHKKNNQENLV